MISSQSLKTKINEAKTSDDYVAIVDTIIASTSVPWFFLITYKSNAEKKFKDFQEYMSKKFSIATENVFLAGSALLGYSLNPEKNYSAFDIERSDIDIAIIDSHLFHIMWDHLFHKFTNCELDGIQYTTIAKNTFKRFIDCRSNYLELSIGEDWIKRVSDYQKDLQLNFSFPEHIGYRIYRSKDDYKSALIKNLYDLKYSQNNRLGGHL